MDFLIEIRTEEIPAFDQIKISKVFQDLFYDSLTKYFDDNDRKIQTKLFLTPNRLSLIISGLTLNVNIKDETFRGPSLKSNSNALDGFLKMHNIQKNDVTINNDYYYYIKKGYEINTKNLLSTISLDILNKISTKWDKTMRINNTNTLWIRPIKQILAIFNSDVVDFEFAGIKSSNLTKGHSVCDFIYSDSSLKRIVKKIQSFFKIKELKNNSSQIVIKDAKLYQEILRKNFVITCLDERIKIIKEQIKEIESQYNIVYDGDEDLIIENAMLCEYPSLLASDINLDIIKNVPHKLINLTIKKNQRYLLFKNKENITKSNDVDLLFDENLSQTFAIVTNNPFAKQSLDIKNNIINGNLKVLNARLSDAKFFIESDIKTGLDEMSKKLQSIQFVHGLGSVKVRVFRIKNVCNNIVNKIKVFNQLTIDDSNKAIDLMKADLTSITVSEFTELQGYVAGYILKHSVDKEDVLQNFNIIQALRNQYTTSVSKNDVENLIKLSENLEKLIGFFAIGQIPTSSKDPFALKRSANIVFDILFYFYIKNHENNNFNFSISSLIDDVFLSSGFKYTIDIKESNIQQLKDFILERFKVNLCDIFSKSFPDINTINISNDLINYKEFFKTLVHKKLLDTTNIGEVFNLFALFYINFNLISDLNFLSLLKSLERLKNVISVENSKDNIVSFVDKINKDLFVNDYEKNLHHEIIFILSNFNNNLILLFNNINLSKTTKVINDFMDNVFIKHEDKLISENRINMINAILLIFSFLY